MSNANRMPAGRADLRPRLSQRAETALTCLMALLVFASVWLINTPTTVWPKIAGGACFLAAFGVPWYTGRRDTLSSYRNQR